MVWLLVSGTKEIWCWFRVFVPFARTRYLAPFRPMNQRGLLEVSASLVMLCDRASIFAQPIHEANRGDGRSHTNTNLFNLLICYRLLVNINPGTRWALYNAHLEKTR